MTENIILLSASTASMHCHWNGSANILETVIKSRYRNYSSNINICSIPKNNQCGLMSG
jgi:hypothetical protein